MLEPLTPLGHAVPGTTTIGAVTISERTETALASLAIRRDRAAEVSAAAQQSGIPLPEPGHYAKDTLAAFWLAPDMWMIEAPYATHEDIRAYLLQHFSDAASITEQTDAWVRFDVTSKTLPALMERLSNFDLAKAADNAATRTVIDHLGCYLIKRSPTEVTLYGPRSSAHSLHHALTTAATSLL